MSTRRRQAAAGAERRLVLLAAVITALALMAIPLAQDPSDMFYRRWYVVELPVLAAILAGLGAEAAARRLRSAHPRATWAFAALLALWLAGAARDTIEIARAARGYFDQGRWQQVMLRAALWSNQQLKLRRADRVAAFSAGLLGWFSDGTVVNLDGLANDEVARLSRRGWSTERYCAYRSVRVYVDALDPAFYFQRYRVLETFANESPEYPTYFIAELAHEADENGR